MSSILIAHVRMYFTVVIYLGLRMMVSLGSTVRGLLTAARGHVPDVGICHRAVIGANGLCQGLLQYM